MTLSSLFESLATGSGRATIDLPADWTQGRTVFGGLLASVSVATARQIVAPERRLRSMCASFVAPVRPSTVTVSAQVLRHGRAVSHVRADLCQHDDGGAEQICFTALLCFGASRDSSLHLGSLEPPQQPDLEQLTDIPFVPVLAPSFSQFFQMRWPMSSMPFSGQQTRETEGWLRLRESLAFDSPHSEALIPLLVDAWPTPSLAMMDRPVPNSSLAWSLELVDQPEAEASTDDWWLLNAAVDCATEGYVQGDSALWDSKARLLAISRQTSTIYDQPKAASKGSSP